MTTHVKDTCSTSVSRPGNTDAQSMDKRRKMTYYQTVLASCWRVSDVRSCASSHPLKTVRPHILPRAHSNGAESREVDKEDFTTQEFTDGWVIRRASNHYRNNSTFYSYSLHVQACAREKWDRDREGGVCDTLHSLFFHVSCTELTTSSHRATKKSAHCRWETRRTKIDEWGFEISVTYFV